MVGRRWCRHGCRWCVCGRKVLRKASLSFEGLCAALDRRTGWEALARASACDCECGWKVFRKVPHEVLLKVSLKVSYMGCWWQRSIAEQVGRCRCQGLMADVAGRCSLGCR